LNPKQAVKEEKQNDPKKSQEKHEEKEENDK